MTEHNSTGPATRPTAHSLYWDNVDRRFATAQARVFEHLGIPLAQDLRDGMSHGDWMDELLTGDGDDILAICDIDAIPLSATAYDTLVARAKAGEIAGLAQACNHLGHPDHIYPAPMFLVMRRSVWRDMGSPSMAPTPEWDAGQAMVVEAEARGIATHALMPNSCVKSVWPLAGKRIYGIGTFYGENDFFHLYMSRKNRYLSLFEAVCDDVCNDREVDLPGYMRLVYPKSKMPKFLRKYFANP